MGRVILAIGVLELIFFFANRYIFGRPPFTTRGAARLPLARRLNVGLAVSGVALIVIGLLFADL